MSQRISHSVLDPIIGPRLKALYPHLHVPKGFPPEGIVLVGHVFALIGAVGFALSPTFWWGGMLAAVGVIGNHTADCVDGTHARATGQCRNGGELLDHFTDPLSFAYWLIGLGIAASSTGLALAAVVCLFCVAVLTNIKAKLLGEFTLTSFGPTEFKTLLVFLGFAFSLIFALDSALVSRAAFAAISALVAIGVVYLPIQLARAVKEVNEFGDPPDQSEWVTVRGETDAAPHGAIGD